MGAVVVHDAVHDCVGWLCPALQAAFLLAPVSFVTHMDSVPLLSLAQLNTDQVRTWLWVTGHSSWRNSCIPCGNSSNKPYGACGHSAAQ